ncbi:MAG: hypothetical protein WA323_14160, partial [Candidatus Nitrosopolaris sp.]
NCDFNTSCLKVKIDKTKKRIGLSDDHCGTENDWRDMMERPFWEKRGQCSKCVSYSIQQP